MKVHHVKSSVVLLVLLFGCMAHGFSQEKKDTVTVLDPKIIFTYLNTSNDTVVLSANIYVSRENGSFALQNAELEFTASDGKVSKVLGKKKAGQDGNAVLSVAAKSDLPVDKDGITRYTVTFAGKGKYTAASESASAKRAKIMVNFVKEDTVHSIRINARQVERNGELKPIAKEKVLVYIPRMLSLLKIGEFELDEKGEGKVDYPEKLVGDSLGNITVVARIEESDKFGNVEGKSVTSWGIPKQYFLAEKPTRELWTPVAPLWMIVTLIIMLTGVWAHYIYAVIQLAMIRFFRQKDSK
jgi:hypothetical protein